MGLFDSINRLVKSGSSGKSAKLVSLEKNNFFGLIGEIYRVGNENKEQEWDSIKYAGIPSYEEIKNFPDDIKKQFIDYLIEYIYEFSEWRSKANNFNYKDAWSEDVASTLLRLIFKQKIDFKCDELVDYLKIFRLYSDYSIFYPYPIQGVFIQIEKMAKAGGLTSKDVAEVQSIAEWKDIKESTEEASKARKRIDSILFLASGEEAAHPSFKFDAGDQFGVYANDWTSKINSETRVHLDEIFRLCSKATQSKPTERYRKNVKEFIDKITIKKFKEIVTPLFEFIISMKVEERVITTSDYSYTTMVFLVGGNGTVVKGLVWCYSHFFDSYTLGIVAKLGERSFKKIPEVGSASTSIGNACIYTLAASKGLEGVSHLSRLKLVLKQNSAQKLVQKYIDEISIKLNISSDEIEDLSTQGFDLIKGKKEIPFDDYLLKVSIEKIGIVSQEWIKPDGNSQKSAPAFIKESKPLSDKLKKIKAEAKVIAKMVTTGRDRLDRSFVNNRKMTLEYFNQYYRDHGLMNFLVKDLVWHFEKGDKSDAAMLHEGKWKNLTNDVLDWIDEETTVRLWHPVFCDSKIILAWREKLIEQELKQPLKQVFREVYLLTDAEVNTRVYSNRMAAHILKQHQFNALTAIRGWKYQLLGAFDNGIDSDFAIKALPKYGMSVEFWIIELASNDDFSDSGIWNYVATDQVRFVDQSGEAIELVAIPTIVLSEILRDVDLFVGVCSVGNDPEWMDNQGNAQHRTYWESYSFGDLNEIAKTRKTILEGIVPRLAIGKVAHIDGKFLVVKGKLRTYKIHLGSTNILMEPNDQYLCIVPSRSKKSSADKVFLPFDGDKGLSVIISKAILLANDDKIKDSTITSQINRS